jgi:hypothetical protein
MRRIENTPAPSALLAFGRRVSAGDAFEDLVGARGWQLEKWTPTFVEACEQRQAALSASGPPPTAPSAWETRQVLRRPEGALRPEACENEARLMVASANELPTLYYVEWHYIDFVLSCLGNVSEAARVLDIRRSTLQRKRKKTPPDR